MSWEQKLKSYNENIDHLMQKKAEEKVKTENEKKAQTSRVGMFYNDILIPALEEVAGQFDENHRFKLRTNYESDYSCELIICHDRYSIFNTFRFITRSPDFFNLDVSFADGDSDARSIKVSQKDFTSLNKEEIQSLVVDTFVDNQLNGSI